MSKFTRPTFNVDDDDLERLQKEFFEKEQMPSAKVYRKNAPPAVSDKPKKGKSLFAERLARSTMPTLEDPTSSLPEDMPALEDASSIIDSMPALEPVDTEIEPTHIEDDNDPQFEPVMDPNPEPHVPVSKKMIDLTSLLGQVLGEIKEHNVEKVTAPTLPIEQDNKPARDQVGGFPRPVHRSEFKKRLEASRNKDKPAKSRLEKPPQISPASQKEDMLDSSLYNDENTNRINEMSEQELEEARQEIMSTLSPESIALLMKGLKNRKKEESRPEINDKKEKKKVSFSQEVEESDDLLQLKKTYFEDVPTENDKLAWMDTRFMTPEIEKQEAEKLEELTKANNENEATEAEKVYRKVRFDLQGQIIDQNKEISRYQGLHHHGDEPDKAGYTLAELFYLVRSQVPSQRSIILVTLTRIIKNAKKNRDSDPVWGQVLTVFTGKEHSAAIYLRSALDDRSLTVLVEAINAIYALVLDELDEQVWEESLLNSCNKFNTFLGHVTHPVLPQSVKQIKRKGLNDKLSELVDRVRQQSGQPVSEEVRRDDADLAERDLVRGLVKMDILPRIRYLLAPDSSELVEFDPPSVERLVRILIHMAEAGQDVCESIEEEEILDAVITWGVTNTQWPMTDEQKKQQYPSLAAVRLLTVLAQGSKQIAESVAEKAIVTLQFLVTSPTVAALGLKRRAYALQVETLKLIRVLAVYGHIVPTLEDLREPVMDWLRIALSSHVDSYDGMRASTAIGLLETLLFLAADPHKTVPAHAIDWHQPTAYLPAVTAVLRASRDVQQNLYESALGYLATWASHIDLFPPEHETVKEVWKAVVTEENRPSNAIALGYTTSANHVLRYIQFIVAYSTQTNHKDLANDAECMYMSAQLIKLLKDTYNKDTLGRYAFWLWTKHCKVSMKCWGATGLALAELESGMKSAHMGTAETWLAQEFLQLCLLSNQLAEYKDSLGPFYLDIQQEKDVTISKALFDHDGRPLKTLMYTTTLEEVQDNKDGSNLELTAFVLSPIDALYHLDKSRVAQKSTFDAATVVANTMDAANKLFYSSDINHDMAIITLMKIFLIGDREGQMAGMESEREIFMDDQVSEKLLQWLDYLCKSKTCQSGLEQAWRRSSEYIRQTQVPFFQFYQGFVAQYAAVSFGHHGFARLLVYLVTQIDSIDYRHLLFSDYRDVLPTIQNNPQLSKVELEQFANAGLKLLD